MFRRKNLALCVITGLALSVVFGNPGPMMVAAAPLALPNYHNAGRGVVFIDKTNSTHRLGQPEDVWEYFEQAEKLPGCIFGNETLPRFPSGALWEILHKLVVVKDKLLQGILNSANHCLMVMKPGFLDFKAASNPKLQQIAYRPEPNLQKGKEPAPAMAICPGTIPFSKLGRMGLSTIMGIVNCDTEEQEIFSAPA